MKRNKSLPRQATWRDGAQGGLVGGLMVVSVAVVASQCIQIDSPPKVADYYEQYRDYKDQYNQLVDWSDRISTDSLAGLLPESVRGAASVIEGKYKEVEQTYRNAAGDLAGEVGGYAEASVKQVGQLSRPDWDGSAGAAAPARTRSGDDLKLCYQLEMGAGIGRMAETGSTDSLSSLCSTEGHRKLAKQSVRPSQGGGGIAPNTAQAAEVTRAAMSDDFALLDVIRGDLAWFRDHPEYHKPFRYDRADLEVSAEEAAQHSAPLQRVGAIMAGRGFADYGYESLRELETLKNTENQFRASTLLGQLNLVYDGMARYATAYPRVASMRDSLLDIDTDMIDDANEAERYRIGIELSSLESEMSMLSTESKQRKERLTGALYSDYLNDGGMVARGDDL